MKKIVVIFVVAISFYDIQAAMYDGFDLFINEPEQAELEKMLPEDFYDEQAIKDSALEAVPYKTGKEIRKMNTADDYTLRDVEIDLAQEADQLRSDLENMLKRNAIMKAGNEISFFIIPDEKSLNRYSFRTQTALRANRSLSLIKDSFSRYNSSFSDSERKELRRLLNQAILLKEEIKNDLDSGKKNIFHQRRVADSNRINQKLRELSDLAVLMRGYLIDNSQNVKRVKIEQEFLRGIDF